MVNNVNYLRNGALFAIAAIELIKDWVEWTHMNCELVDFWYLKKEGEEEGKKPKMLDDDKWLKWCFNL